MNLLQSQFLEPAQAIKKLICFFLRTDDFRLTITVWKSFADMNRSTRLKWDFRDQYLPIDTEIKGNKRRMSVDRLNKAVLVKNNLWSHAFFPNNINCPTVDTSETLWHFHATSTFVVQTLVRRLAEYDNTVDCSCINSPRYHLQILSDNLF